MSRHDAGGGKPPGSTRDWVDLLRWFDLATEYVRQEDEDRQLADAMADPDADRFAFVLMAAAATEEMVLPTARPMPNRGGTFSLQIVPEKGRLEVTVRALVHGAIKLVRGRWGAITSADGCIHRTLQFDDTGCARLTLPDEPEIREALSEFEITIPSARFQWEATERDE